MGDQVTKSDDLAVLRYLESKIHRIDSLQTSQRLSDNLKLSFDVDINIRGLTPSAAPLSFSGAPGEIRTPDPLVRSQMLYPIELRAQSLTGKLIGKWGKDENWESRKSN